MDFALNSFFLICGVGLLYFGADILVRGAVAGATRLHISPLAVGLTVVAFGTSAPEIVVSLASALQGHSAVAVGNVVGSNIINTAVILGLVAVFTPMAASKKVIFVDLPVMLFSYALLSLVLFGFFSPFRAGEVVRFEALLLLAVLIVYLFSVYVIASRKKNQSLAFEVEEVQEGQKYSNQSWFVLALMVIGGGVFLAVGGEVLLRGAVWYAAEVFGVSQKVIGITIVALATSFPELFTSVVAVIRKEHDISLGNIIGSNIFNALAVLGISAVISPIRAIEEVFSVDVVFMAATAVFLWLLFLWRGRIGRATGIVFLASYVLYLVYVLGGV